MDLYVHVDKPVPGLESKILTGKFYSKVYEGPFQDTGKWFNDFNKRLLEKGYKDAKVYTWYTTCPKCAKKYGKNYVAMVAKVG
jgi:hypothetical protein